MEREQIGATVEQAAVSIGCELERIAKAMSFFIDEKAVMIVMAGDAKLDNVKYKAYFHQKAKMIPGEMVEIYIGHVPDAVCPFAIKVGVSERLSCQAQHISTYLKKPQLERYAEPYQFNCGFLNCL